MTTYYVKSSTGSDANNGLTTAGAFLTISKGCIAAVAGDTVLCLSGSYNASIYINATNMKNGTSVAPITLKSPVQYAAKILALGAPTSSAMIEIRRDYWIIDGFEFSAAKGYSGGPGTWAWVGGGTGQYRQGIYYSGANGLMQNNLVHDLCLASPGGSGGAGIEIEGFYNSYITSNSVICYNIVHDTASSLTTNKSHGIYMTTKGVKIQSNLVHSVFGGCNIHGWHGFDGPSQIANNTLFDGTNCGILFGQGDGGANASTPGPANVKIFNNIIMDIDGGGAGISTFIGSTSPPMGSGNVVGYNLTTNCTRAYSLNASLINYTTLPQFSAPVGLVNYIRTGGGDYHLATGSTCIDRGVASLSSQKSVLLDIDGVSRPQGTKWDLGAYEFVQTSDTTPPTFVSAVVQNATPTVLTITMSETLGATVPPASAFSVGKTITNVQVSGSTVILTVSTAYISSDIITVSYTKPASSPWIVDAVGNAAASFGPNSVTNNVGSVGVPSDPGASSSDFGGRDRKFNRR